MKYVNPLTTLISGFHLFSLDYRYKMNLKISLISTMTQWSISICVVGPTLAVFYFRFFGAQTKTITNLTELASKNSSLAACY